MRGAAVATLCALLGAAACRAPTPADPLPQPVVAPAAAAWPATFAAVRGFVDGGSYARADSALAAFAERYVGTPESGEARYWRALVQLDPANPAATPRDALAAIDGYLAGGQQQPRYLEALVLRRAASTLAAALPVEPRLREPAVVPDTVPSERLRAAEDSVRALRAELERTTAELERIRRRLRPNPPPLAAPAPVPAPAPRDARGVPAAAQPTRKSDSERL